MTRIRHTMCKAVIAAFVACAALVLSLAPVLGVVPQAQGVQQFFPMYSWGPNLGGSLGHGTLGGAGQSVPTPTRIGTDSWKYVTTAGDGSFAINARGELFAWGSDRIVMGQGAALSENLTAPTRIGTASNWEMVVGNWQSALAINSEGHLYAWGNGSHLLGQSDTTADVLFPTRVGNRADWAYVSIASGAVAALTTGGALYIWGPSNVFLPDGPTSVPTRIGTASNWESISSGFNWFMAINSQGHLYAWGSNSFGALGIPGQGATNIPTRVPIPGNARVVSAVGTGMHLAGAAITSDGHLYTWGSGFVLGRPVAVPIGGGACSTPTRVGTDNDWVSLTAGAQTIVAFREDNSLWGWGNSNGGALGLPEVGFLDEPRFITQTHGFRAASVGASSWHIMIMTTTAGEGFFDLSKDLQKPAGTPVPTLSFNFRMDARSFNDSTDSAVIAENFPPGTTELTRQVTIDASSASSTTGGIVTLTDSTNILSGIGFARPGVYSWTIRELDNATGIGPNSSVIFSQAQYELRVYVRRAATGAEYYVAYTTLHRLYNTYGNPVNPPVKVTDGLSFINRYTRTTTGTQNCYGALWISKAVDGAIPDLTAPFTFDITLTGSAFCAPNRTFSARVYSGTTFVRTETFTSGVERSVVLLHNQRLVLPETVVGTRFDVTERAVVGYTASLSLVVNGQAPVVTTNPSPNMPLGTGVHTIGADLRNSAAFTNIQEFAPPTGLVIGTGHTPFIFMGVAGIMLAASLSLKARRRIEDMPAMY